MIKLYTCEEGGAHLRISFWHLLVNFEKPEKSEFWKMKKKKCWRYHFKHVHRKPQLYEVYGSWDIEWDKIFLSFWTIFCSPPPFRPPPNNPKNQNFEKMKKASGYVIISHLHTKKTIISCMLTLIWSATDIFFCHFRPFFALFPHYWPQKLKSGKNVKNTWKYYPFPHVYHRRSYDLWFLRFKVQRT